MFKTYYNLFKKGSFVSRTQSLKIAEQLKVLGWDYQIIKVLK